DGWCSVARENACRLYVPSMIPKDGHLFVVLDAGLAACLKSDTGEELWKERLGGDFFASPVMVGDRIYASNVAGKTFVFVATPKTFQLLASNQLGEEAFASPVFATAGFTCASRRREPSDRRFCIASARSRSEEHTSELQS